MDSLAALIPAALLPLHAAMDGTSGRHPQGSVYLYLLPRMTSGSIVVGTARLSRATVDRRFGYTDHPCMMSQGTAGCTPADCMHAVIVVDTSNVGVNVSWNNHVIINPYGPIPSRPLP